MVVYMFASFLMAFLFSSLFGKRYVSWLEKNGIRQPIKDEVAKIYDQAGDSEKDKTSETL